MVGAAFGSDTLNEQTAPVQAHVVEALSLGHLREGARQGIVLSQKTGRAVIELALKPVHGGGAEIREAVLRPQLAVPSETTAVAGPGSDLRVAPSLVGDTG